MGQSWVTRTQVKAVRRLYFIVTWELTLTHCFNRSSFPVKNGITASHFSFSHFGVGVSTIRLFCHLGSYFLIVGKCSKAENQMAWFLGILPTLELFVPRNINLPWLPDTPSSPVICQNSKLYAFNCIIVHRFATDGKLT